MRRLTRSFFKLLKKDSTTALPQQLPREPKGAGFCPTYLAVLQPPLSHGHARSLALLSQLKISPGI